VFAKTKILILNMQHMCCIAYILLAKLDWSSSTDNIQHSQRSHSKTRSHMHRQTAEPVWNYSARMDGH